MNDNITERRIAKHTKRKYLALIGLVVGIALALVDIFTQGGLSAWPILIIFGCSLDIAYEMNQTRALNKIRAKE